MFDVQSALDIQRWTFEFDVRPPFDVGRSMLDVQTFSPPTRRWTFDVRRSTFSLHSTLNVRRSKFDVQSSTSTLDVRRSMFDVQSLDSAIRCSILEFAVQSVSSTLDVRVRG